MKAEDQQQTKAEDETWVHHVNKETRPDINTTFN